MASAATTVGASATTPETYDRPRYVIVQDPETRAVIGVWDTKRNRLCTGKYAVVTRDDLPLKAHGDDDDGDDLPTECEVCERSDVELQPCQGCRGDVAYCSDECRDASWSTEHNAECGDSVTGRDRRHRRHHRRRHRRHRHHPDGTAAFLGGVAVGGLGASLAGPRPVVLRLPHGGGARLPSGAGVRPVRPLLCDLIVSEESNPQLNAPLF
ncbi:hypothetical protein U1Q18_051973 [Sarracenia purpurea var. burkii]